MEFGAHSGRLSVVKIKIYTDGSCLGNPGPGGWAYLIRAEEMGAKILRGQGGEAHTTNNRMEMLAAIEALHEAEKRWPPDDFSGNVPQIELYSDSSLLINTMNLNWKRKKNVDLWEELAPLAASLRISWHWVRGHNGHLENEDCDKRAQIEAAKQAKTLSGAPSGSFFS